MGKRTALKKDLSGPWYDYKGNSVELAPAFIYEISIYKYWNRGFCLIDSKCYYASELLPIKKDSEIKKYKDFSLLKEISLVGVPQEFINNNNLKQL